MTTIQKQIAERLRNSYTCICDDAYKRRRRADPGCARCSVIELEACSVEDGAWGDILGKQEPTIDDVRDEAQRVYGKEMHIDRRFMHIRVWDSKRDVMNGDALPLVSAPSVAAVYCALRALPSKVAG